jgi:integrase
MVHKESLALAEEWLQSLTYGSVKNRGKPLAPRTIDRYRDIVVGRGRQKAGHPTPPMLVWWHGVAPGEPIWVITREQLLTYVYAEVHASGGGTAEPSSSEVNNRRSALLNLLTWAATSPPMGKGLPVLSEVLTYQPPVEERMQVRRKNVQLHPIEDGVFGTIWATIIQPDDYLWIGAAAFATMRIDEIADLRPSDVDLDRQMVNFVAKGRKRRTVHYGELLDDWSYLEHLGHDAFIPNEWVKRFEDHVFKRQADAEQMPPGAGDPPWWVWPHTEGEWRPHRDNPRQRIWSPSANDRNRFSKRWRSQLTRAGLGRYHDRPVVTPHQLRHFCSVNMWRAGVPWHKIVAEMGHDDSATTYAYSDFRPEYNRERARNERKRARAEE